MSRTTSHPGAPSGSDAGSEEVAGSEGDQAILEEARRVLRLEAASVNALVGRLDEEFVRASRLLAGAEGRVVVSGLGKSGHVARKLASTLTSTGTPASYLHPVESLHGDMGIIGRRDVAILVSKSGETQELAGLMDYLLRMGVPIVALTGRPESELARHATVVLDCSVAEEACPMDLAPTSSTTAALAMGDALAVVVLQLKGFEAEDFALLHPGGTLGRTLTLGVRDVMVSDEVPTLPPDATIREAIAPLAKMRGTVVVVDAQTRLAGVLTAGDLTRLMERDPNFLQRPVSDVMTREPKVAALDELAAAAVRRMEEFGIMALPVLDQERRVRGIVHLHDILRSGVV